MSLRATIAPLACVLALAGCGGAGDQETTSMGGTGSGSATDWPIFGRVVERTHYIANAPDPPFHYLWEFPAGQLIEFPPVLADGLLFIVNKTGEVYVVRSTDGKRIWKTNLGNDVTSPAHADGIVYLAQYDGTLTAIDVVKRRQAWEFKADSRLESSPLATEGRVFVGSDGGYLYALDAATGKLDWKRKLGDTQVEASPSYHDGVIYVGDYNGTVYALDGDSGKLRWSTDTTELPPGTSGGFYSSPSIAFGRVFEARNDGTVYALDQETGKLDWHFVTSNSIYGSPAAAEVPGTPPTVYIGSYDHQLYALEAETGNKRWAYDVGGQVPGTPTVVGKTVYTSSFQTKKTVGLDARTGKKVFGWGSAGYTPMISDGERVYLTGFQTVWGFDAKSGGGG